ncbi:KAT8 regulatory NSL complex subunit 1-like protein [Rhincodon typus]|uniref:KAT8 regulatory NSL complex subunit 1-like protein n=1 Tax=Rhincodon typus TaxID=259920 RepID=UPI002030F007|nr:KAT8 regulatory NSL complex subunit 1-like protein [Rhincodon typus]
MGKGEGKCADNNNKGKSSCWQQTSSQVREREKDRLAKAPVVPRQPPFLQSRKDPSVFTLLSRKGSSVGEEVATLSFLGNIFIAVGLLGQHCMATMAPALTETATEPHGFQLSSSSLSSSSIEPDAFFHEEDTITEQKLNGECHTQSAWSQLVYPFATRGLGSDATETKHVPYRSGTVHCAIPNNLLTAPDSLLGILSFNCNLNNRKTLFSKSSAVILAKKLSCDRTKQTPASKASKMYFVPETELSSNNNGTKELNSQKYNALECMDILTTAHQVTLACDSLSMTLNDPGGITTNQKAMLKPTKGNKTWDAVPAQDDIQFENLLNSARQPTLQRNQEKQLCNSMKIRKIEGNTELHECLGRQQELTKKASLLKKRLQLIQAKHVEHQVKCKIQEFIKCQHEGQAERCKINSSNTESVFPSGIKHSGGVQTGFISTSINSELFEDACFSKALLSHIEESVDSDATSSSTDEDSDSEEIALNRNMPFKYRSEKRWTLDRAEVASRWTWLQAQISELEFRIRQINEIYKHIRVAKETVTLGDSQCSGDSPKKQMELTETAALLAAADDNKTPVEIKDSTLECSLEISPSSPLLLLRNIDKQSAQLTESVNSLIPPLNLSPASSPVSCKTYKHPGSFFYSVLGDDVSGSSDCFGSEECQPKTEHPDRTTQQLLSVDDTSARTRPLRMQHKHRPFGHVYDTSRWAMLLLGIEDVRYLVSKDGQFSTVGLYALHIETLNVDISFTSVFDVHKDSLSKRHCSLLNPRETPGSLVKTAQTSVFSPIQQTPCSSPTGTEASRSSTYQRSLPQTKDIPSRQRQQSECCYDIDNIVIPMSLVATSKIEKLQYKEIITPSWRIVPIKPSKERHTPGEVLEDISDEAFSLRHKKHEKWEQARWFLWEQSKCHRRGNRSSSFSKNNDEHLNPHLPASPDIQNQLNCTSSGCCVSEVAQTEEPQDLHLEGGTNAKVVLPWNCRTFPLNDEETKHLTHPEVAVSDKVGPQPLTRSYLALSGNSPTNQSPTGTGSSDRVPSNGHIATEEAEYKLSLWRQSSVMK